MKRLNKAEEIKKLKAQIKGLIDEAANVKVKDQGLEEEAKKKADEAAFEAVKFKEKEMLKQTKAFQDEIDRLNKALDSSRKEMEEKVAFFENEKEALKIQILSDNKSDSIIQGKLLILISLFQLYAL